MPAKFFTAVLIFYFSALIQSSFLPHFAVFGYVPNLIFILIIFSAFFAPSLGFAAAFFGGIFLDIFSANFFGFYVLMAMAITFFIQLIFRRYVQIAFR